MRYRKKFRKRRSFRKKKRGHSRKALPRYIDSRGGVRL